MFLFYLSQLCFFNIHIGLLHIFLSFFWRIIYNTLISIDYQNQIAIFLTPVESLHETN